MPVLCGCCLYLPAGIENHQRLETADDDITMIELIELNHQKNCSKRKNGPTCSAGVSSF